jgi:spermidine synthase
MIPRELIGVADVPNGPPLRLVRHGADFIIMLDRNELMSSRMRGSEIALGIETCRRLPRRAAPKILIGGYGMGFTLRAVLGELDANAFVTVAELVPTIIDWAKGPMADMTGGCLDDPRVDLWIGDVADALAPDRYDAILLDVDNGPDGLTREGNNRLYSLGGLARMREALSPGGILAIWSAAPDADFTRRLKRAEFSVEEIRVRARENGKGPIHTIWFATAS